MLTHPVPVVQSPDNSLIDLLGPRGTTEKTAHVSEVTEEMVTEINVPSCHFPNKTWLAPRKLGVSHGSASLSAPACPSRGSA